ncbi:LysR family transcriptional regulator, nitrogen assimilation regulatory protein [Cohaesibacter marisflavi]|uniref:LysR family transcriptional regulator, nitrogen assimilation regulatory protein n=1 Tax=Cohaesibacter marisflavi TaxID=655353 RepID=A0A1I5M367_9HYPH|nr:nitrogen assimilation transcriptional regulator NAC [Cohaesibacter marisflavi]SFP03940.1 LysR family transcriptional regulator, nitrogen assimilation regulatory protein [Cohaesibacter marisflavi]
MDTKRLSYFIKIIDKGSLTRAADALNIAQPALSQHLIGLEAHFKQQLVIRSRHGVTPTEAGNALYRHAQIILKQMDFMSADVCAAAKIISGSVSVGLAPYSTTSTLSLSLLKEVKRKYPEITLHINDNFGSIFSELVMNGRMDLALIYDPGMMRGVNFQQVAVEELFLISRRSLLNAKDGATEISFKSIENIPLLLPSKIHLLRALVDNAFEKVQVTPNIVAEIESMETLGMAISEGMGSTILPWSAASRMSDFKQLILLPLKEPKIEASISICVSDSIPLSEPAMAVHDILFKLVRELIASNQWPGVRPPQ